MAGVTLLFETWADAPLERTYGFTLPTFTAIEVR